MQRNPCFAKTRQRVKTIELWVAIIGTLISKQIGWSSHTPVHMYEIEISEFNLTFLCQTGVYCIAYRLVLKTLQHMLTCVGSLWLSLRSTFVVIICR